MYKALEICRTPSCFPAPDMVMRGSMTELVSIGATVAARAARIAPVRLSRRSCCLLAAVFTFASGARAQVVMDQGASIVIFPKVVADAAGHDTIIQIANTGNSIAHARCFYVSSNIAGPGTCASSLQACTTDADCLGDRCVRAQTQTEFPVSLTRQQPTFWVLSHGRQANNAPPGLNNLVPAVTLPFQGELLCVEVDESGAPLTANALIGQATLVDAASGDVAKYHAVGLQGNPELSI
jgi:hypothetical protein